MCDIAATVLLIGALIIVPSVQTRQALRPEDINDMCFVDVNAHKELFESLKSNVKVAFDGERFSYKVYTTTAHLPSS